MTHKTTRIAARLAIAGAIALLGAAPAFADDFSDRFDVHGFGHQDYMRSSDNTYLGADNKGSWNNNFLGLVMAAKLTDESKLWAQLESTADEGTRFTWFFVDYQIGESSRVHVGRVKLPLGFYNEIIDVKALQVTALEPSLYQTAADMVHDAYHGVGYDYEQDIAGGHVLWQVWGGNVYDIDPPEDSRDRSAFGGRATYRTPVDGLSFMLSAYRTRVQLLADKSMSNEDRVIGGAEYVRDAWDVKAEYARHKFMGVNSSAYYVQAGYEIVPKWTPYVRYDYVNTDDMQRSSPSYYQKTAVLGLGYKVNDKIALKIENHFNRGYALPVASGELAVGAGVKNWNLTVASANFAF
jgi:hypothetical protein